MHRRFKGIASTLLGLVGICSPLLSIGLGGVGSDVTSKEKAFLSRPISIRIQDAPIVEAVDLLRKAGGVSISLIIANTAESRKVNLAPGNLVKILDTLVAQVSAYRYEVFEGRVVVYPRDPLFDRELPGIEIRETKRIEAAARYADWLSQVLPEIEPILPPLMKGNAEAEIYSDLVSISGRGRIVDHLVQLLGDNPRAFFSIEPALSGRRILVLGEIPEGR
jgi:hypothetical protein